MLCGAALSVFLCRNMIPGGEGPGAWPSSSSSTISSSWLKGHHRAVRAADKPSLFRECYGLSDKGRKSAGNKSYRSYISYLLQSYTEGEVKQLISALVDRSGPEDSRLDLSLSKRTKRARKGLLKPCSLKELEVSVSQLGLGYEGDEILLFRYCSGRCQEARRNYDLTLEHMKKQGRVKKGKARHKPCCRPTEYDDDISFLDNGNKYHTIREVSARKCGCV
uniref:Neurturin n=1 Tax=Lepisosteus oculatus TaxID=7918 RepID=W5M5U7_LEPOC